jgi:hypothetical protein
MNAKLSYGLILAAGNIVLTLVGFLLGYQSDNIANGTWFSFLIYVLCVVVLWLGIKAVREEAKDKSLSYGKGVGSGVLIALYGQTLAAIYSFFHLTFINPNFGEFMMNAMRQKWAAAHMSDAQIEQASNFMRFTLSPVWLSIIGLIYMVLFALVVALVVSAFLRRAPQPVVEDAPVA